MSRDILAALLLLAVLPACAHKASVAAAPVEEAAPSAPAAVQPQASPAPAPAPEQTCSRDDDCSSNSLCVRSRCVPITPELVLAECSAIRVHFAFDSWILRPEDRPLLDRVGRCLRADQELRVTVEGNADERGTEEYNLQLGAKRANQVHRYLEALGVPDGQLRSISYGHERPRCTEHNEACWAVNRRVGVKAQQASQ